MPRNTRSVPRRLVAGRCLRAVRARLRATSLRAERGGVLVEVMVSAVILVVVAGATFKAIDAASSASAKTKTKSVATSLAQKYMDDLRSQDPAKLSALKTNGSGAEVVQNVTYSYATTAAWVRDATQDKSCDGQPGDYLKLSVTVTWSTMTASDKPVTVYSILTEPNGTYENQGNLAVSIQNASATGVAGIPVTLTPGGLTDTTDANGCAYFANLAPGAYTSNTISKPGYVDPDGNTTLSGSWTIVAGQTQLQQWRYDVGQAPTVNVKLGSTTGPATTAENVTFFHINRTSALVLGDGTTGQTSYTPASAVLYPFTSNYSVYSGSPSCAANAAVATNVTLPSSPITVVEPPINIQIKNSSSTVITDGVTNAHVKVKSTACGVNKAVTPAADGSISTIGWPANTYNVCADYLIGGTRYQLTYPITLNTQGGNATQVYLFKTGTAGLASGSCP